LPEIARGILSLEGKEKVEFTQEGRKDETSKRLERVATVGSTAVLSRRVFPISTRE
jgi:hypothetical protein